MVPQFSPFVYWAQTATQITFKIDLKDAREPSIKLAAKRIEFACEGRGARGEHHYGFNLDLYADIDVDEVRN